MTTNGIRDSIKLISPPWLTGLVGERLMYAIGTVIDTIIEQLNQGLHARMPLVTETPTSLALVGADRVIERGFQEADDSYALRLSQAWDTWRRAGMPQTVLSQLLAYVAPSFPIVKMVSNNSIWDKIDGSGVWTKTYVSPLNWVWDDADVASVLPSQWFRTWIIMYGSNGPWTGAEGVWGTGTWGDGGAWGFAAAPSGPTPAQVSDWRRIAAKWKGQHDSVQWLIWTSDTLVGDAMFDETKAFGDGSLPDGKWGNWSKVVAGVQVASRSNNARYISGVT